MKTEQRHKKSETIEARVPWRLKQAFMAKARREGVPASEVLRRLMEDYVRRPAHRTATETLESAMNTVRKHPRPAFAAILGAAGISAVLAGAIPAGAAPDLRAAFDMLDADGDGVVTEEEYQRPARREFQLVRRDADDDADAPQPAPPEGRIMLPVTAPGGDGAGELRLIVRRETGDGSAPAADMPRSPEEVMAREFASTDADGDKALTFAEFTARHDAMRAESFATMDVNKDGVIDAEEAAAVRAMGDMAGAALDAMDTNGDGQVSRAEYEDAV